MQWKPISHIIQQLEFRIFHNIFCNIYKIKRGAIAFDEYAQKVFEKFVEQIVEIRPVDWLQIVFLIMLNFFRNELEWQGKDCEHHHDKENFENESSFIVYISAGFFFFFFFLL